MGGNPFLRFIDLVTFDQKINSLENDILSVNNQIMVLEKEKKAIQHDLDDAHQLVIKSKKRVDAEELEMKSLDHKEQEKKRQLDGLSDYREYQAIKSEVEAIQRIQVSHEHVVLDAWNQLENAQIAEEKKKKELADRLAKIEQSRSELENKSSQLKAESEQMLTLRTEKEAHVPAEWLEKYSMMRSRVADPVVEISHQSCGACSQIITNQDFARAKKGALVQCQKCYRLLYASDIRQMHA